MRIAIIILALVLLLCLSAVPMVPSAEATSPVWETEGQMPGERSGFVSAELYDGRMLIALGYNSSAAEHINDTWIFDPGEVTWTAVADSPVMTEASTAACINDVVYIFGGRLSNYSYMETVLVYNVYENEWSVGPVAPFEGMFLKAAAIDDHRIIIVGTDPDRRGCYIYDTLAMSFSEAEDLPEGRLSGTLVKDDERLLYFGGWDSTNTVQEEVFGYNIGSDYWWTVSVMPEARFGMTGVMGTDGLVYLLGGAAIVNWYSDSLEKCLAFDTYYGNFIELPDLPEAVRYAAAVESEDGRIICFGGHEGNLGMLNVYSVQAWEVEASLSSDTVEQGGSVWLSVSVHTSFAPMEELYGYAFLTAMGVTYAVYDIYSLGNMAYLEIPISEGITPLGYVVEIYDLGFNYEQDFVFEPMALTVTAAPSTDDRLDDLQGQLDSLQDELNSTRDELKEAVDAKMDAMIGYVILIMVIATLVVAVLLLVRKR